MSCNVIQDNWNVSHIIVFFPWKGVLGLIDLSLVLCYFTLKTFSKQICRLDLGEKNVAHNGIKMVDGACMDVY